METCGLAEVFLVVDLPSEKTELRVWHLERVLHTLNASNKKGR